MIAPIWWIVLCILIFLGCLVFPVKDLVNGLWVPWGSLKLESKRSRRWRSGKGPWHYWEINNVKN